MGGRRGGFFANDDPLIIRGRPEELVEGGFLPVEDEAWTIPLIGLQIKYLIGAD